MKNFLTPDLLDSFLERTQQAMPEGCAPSPPSCKSLGQAWRRIGLRPGDVVLLCLPNGKELLHQFFGVLMAQGVPALLAPAMPVARLREIAQAIGARAIGMFRLPVGNVGAQRYEVIGPLQV